MKKILILSLIVFLAGCNKLDCGFVVSKHFVPARMEQYVTYVYSGETLVPVFNYRFIPDEWSITIEGEYKNKIRHERFLVSQQDFEKINIGDFYRVRRSE